MRPRPAGARPSAPPHDEAKPRRFWVVEPPPAPAPDLSARQRWRLYLQIPATLERADGAVSPAAWAAALEREGLPLAGSGGSRNRVAAAATLPLSVAGKREVVDVWLRTALPLLAVRAAVTAALPPGVELVDLHDVWIGAPAPAAAATDADYRIELARPDLAEAMAACRALLAATELPRTRRREKKATDYDLRPLLVAIRAVPPGPGDPARCRAVLEVRLRHGPDGVGRPDEVLAALSERQSPDPPLPVDVIAIVRTRLLLDG